MIYLKRKSLPERQPQKLQRNKEAFEDSIRADAEVAAKAAADGAKSLK